jgi:solute carrier family 36 (proton-coupled amino acid transporter)
MTDTLSSNQDERRQAEVVSEHLPAGFSADFDAARDDSGAASSSAPDLSIPQEQSSLKLQGGDIHRDLYKIDARARLHQRANTFSGPDLLRSTTQDEMPVAEQTAPGGFRRQYVQQKYGSIDARNVPIARSFVDFLDLFGSFAGEDLFESEEESAVDDVEDGEQSERSPLLGRRKSTKASKKGDASASKTFFTLLKAFIGTGIMFLPKAFQNGGILFASITLVTVSIVTTIAFHLLLQCRARYGGGYGELGETIGGSKMRAIILGSITLSQLGFVCSGTIFVADNLKSFANAVSNGTSPLSTNSLIALQLIVLIPLALIRDISKLGPVAMIADVLILLGLAYIWSYDIGSISKLGVADSVVLFNPDHYTLTIGAAIFTFEGIGLILPIASSMKQPEKFDRLLYAVMIIITVIFGSVGMLCYMTFGSETRIEVIDNFPQTSKLVNAVQFLYAIAVLVGTPVQLFPAVRIIEGKIFGRLSGKYDHTIQWKKNGFRTILVVLCILVSILGSANLDRFVALIGSFACVPLVYIYPPLLHYKGIAESRLAKTGDIVLMVAGFVGMVYTTVVTVVNSFLQP